jgi:signal transduction histidine kinase
MTIGRMMNEMRNFLSFKPTDPAQARRKRLLNILMLGISLFAFLGLIATAILSIFKIAAPGEILLLFFGSLVCLLVGFLLLALISWLSARGLEKELVELRSTNGNLNRLVQEKTRDLALALEREKFESGQRNAVLDSIADGVIVFDLRGIAIVANPSSAYLLDIPHEDLIGITIDRLGQSAALDARNRGLLASLLTAPGQRLTSYRIQWGKKAISVTCAQINDSMGARIGTLAVFRDHTHEAEAERMKNTFLATVSHELRTPLNAILGYAEMLKEAVYGPINEKQVRASERIMLNSQRLLEIVSDLLDQAQMEAGNLTIHVRPFRPVELIEAVHTLMDKIAVNKGLALTSELDEHIPEYINGDAARLQQIIVNLISNGVKFTDHGSIHLLFQYLDKKRWAIEVQDTGMGIPEDELSTIFEAFRQVDSTTTRKHGGFGLGLTIVKQLADLMGGELGVTSKLNHGSTFTVTLPLIPARRRPQ